MKILYLAYACEPGAGSEYGVGWMMPQTMARQHPEYEVYILTRSKSRQKIDQTLDFLAEEGTLRNIHVLYYDLPSLLYYKKEMQSHWGEQYNYWLWQLCVRRTVRKIIREKDIDIVHHITFNQYRTPSPGYWMDVPFVIGPIGGAEIIAPAFWQDLDPHTAKKEAIRKKGRDLPLFRWLNTRSKNKKIILCSANENLRRLSPYKGNSNICLMPAIGISQQDINSGAVIQQPSTPDGQFTMVYAGKALDWKGLHIFLRTAARAFKGVDKSYGIKLIGIRSESEQQKVNGWIVEEGLQGRVELIPFMQRDELLKIISTCSLSVYPAFRDSGSMSVLEACSLGCPTICFDAGGQDAFPDEVLIKVRVGESYEECVDAFAERLRWCITHPAELTGIGHRSQEWVREHMTWEQKVKSFAQIYSTMIGN